MKSTNKGEGVNHLWEKTITVSILQTADQESEGLKSARGYLLQNALLGMQNR